MTQHLTDVACLEWVRNKRIALAPETTGGVEVHLAGCAECRKKVADFEALERSFHPYGSPMSRPGALAIGKAIMWTAIALGVAGLATIIVAAF
jgi:hypothetical protein